jgi:hypothetical protein
VRSPESRRQQSQVHVRRHELEVSVRREHDQIVPTAELGEQRVDRTDLDALAAKTFRSCLSCMSATKR